MSGQPKSGGLCSPDAHSAGRIGAASGSLAAIQSAVAPGTQVWAWAAKGKPAARRSAYNAVRSVRAECLAAATLEEPPQSKLLLPTSPPVVEHLRVVVEHRRKCRGGDYRASACDAVISITRSAPFGDLHHMQCPFFLQETTRGVGFDDFRHNGRWSTTFS